MRSSRDRLYTVQQGTAYTRSSSNHLYTVLWEARIYGPVRTTYIWLTRNCLCRVQQETFIYGSVGTAYKRSSKNRLYTVQWELYMVQHKPLIYGPVGATYIWFSRNCLYKLQ